MCDIVSARTERNIKCTACNNWASAHVDMPRSHFTSFYYRFTGCMWFCMGCDTSDHVIEFFDFPEGYMPDDLRVLQVATQLVILLKETGIMIEKAKGMHELGDHRQAVAYTTRELIPKWAAIADFQSELLLTPDLEGDL